MSAPRRKELPELCLFHLDQDQGQVNPCLCTVKSLHQATHSAQVTSNNFFYSILSHDKICPVKSYAIVIHKSNFLEHSELGSIYFRETEMELDEYFCVTVEQN